MFEEKTLAHCLLVSPKVATPPNFQEKTFANSHKTLKFVKFSSLKVSRYTLYARLSMPGKPGCSKTMEEAASSNSTLMLYQQQLLAPALKQHSLKFTTTMSYIHQLVAISLTVGPSLKKLRIEGHCVQ